MILISKTYTETTPESAQDGDFSDRGFISEKEEVTFSELVDLMRDHCEASCSPNDMGINVWYSSGDYTKDYKTATKREECIHYHHENPSKNDKYWKWARIFADSIIAKRKNR